MLISLPQNRGSRQFTPLFLRKATSTGRRSDHYWSRREVVLVTIAYQYWSAQRPVLVHFISSTASRIEFEGKQTHIEVWYARELQELLGYTRWENFVVAIQRAITSYNSNGGNDLDHFREVTKMIEVAKGGRHSVSEFYTQSLCMPLGERGIKPEELPPADDIKKLERRVAREEKALGQEAQKLPQAQAVDTEKE